ncbi:MAG TPA: Uma2 family endonuclease [Thermoanaerobaculia bacterium]|nr:Uma2 family endonuclease [Thermoanaerobaculia bacterium]
MASEPQHPRTVEEYLVLERQSETRSEYWNGEIYVMTGASRRHNRIALNVAAALDRQLAGRGCEVFVSDMRVKVPAARLFTYPDVVVACDAPEFSDGETDTLLNPTLIVEVLSPNTERYDRGLKFESYRTLPSLAEYVLISQDRLHVEHFVRQGGGSWLLTETDRSEECLDLLSVGCRLALAEICQRVF